MRIYLILLFIMLAQSGFLIERQVRLEQNRQLLTAALTTVDSAMMAVYSASNEIRYCRSLREISHENYRKVQ